MNKNNPQVPPQVQMTPVEFSPSEPTGSPEAPITSPVRPPFQYPVFLPLLIILLTLIFSTARDIVALNKRLAIINQEDAPSLELLKKSGKQMEFIEALRKDLVKLSPSDPEAARIISDYFPEGPAQKSDSADAKTPAK